MLGPSFKTLTANHVYSCHNRQKFPQQVATHLSSKPKTFVRVIIPFLKARSNFAQFEKKVYLHTFNISGVIDSGKCG